MDNTFHLSVITPEHEFFDGQAESLVFSCQDGEIGVMAGHMPMVAAVMDGDISFKVGGEWKTAANSEGYVTIMPDQVLLMVQTVEWPDQIDIARAERAARRARERLRQKASMHEYHEARTSLSRAMARLRVTGGRHID